MSEVYEVMKKYGHMMANQGYPIGDTAKMVIETADGVFATKAGADVAVLSEGDIEKLEIARLPVADEEIKAVVYSQTPYCQQCLNENKPIKAALDDMAQIVGHTAEIIDVRESNRKREREVRKALKDNVGCMVLKSVDDSGNLLMGHSLTLGRNLYEAVVAMTVLEKSAEVSILAEKLGGDKPIPKWEAKLMRFIYKKKYSKAEEKVKTQEVN